MSIFALAAVVTCATAISAKFERSAIKAENDEVTYIPFNDVNFSGQGLELFVGDRNGAQFWAEHRKFNAVDNFYKGESNEGQTGTIRSIDFVQTKKYITFTLGGNPGDINNPENYVRLMKENGEEDLEIARECNRFWSDPTLCWNMITYVMEVPDEHLNSTMYIELVDNRTGGFGGINFGYLHVNQDIAGVGRNIARHKASIIQTNQMAEGDNYGVWNRPAAQYTFECYRNEYYTKYTQIGYAEDYVPNEDFEDANTWADDWFFDSSYARFTNVADEDRNSEYAWPTDFNSVNASSDLWGENFNFEGNDYPVPHNHEGSRFFRGAAGLGNENVKWRLNSNPFKLTHDFISFKTAGRTAELQLIDAVTFETVATFRNQSYLNGNHSLAYKDGKSPITLNRHIWNVSAFKNPTELNPNSVYILAMADSENGGDFGCMLFDSIEFTNECKYKVDVITQDYQGAMHYGAWLDKYGYAGDAANDNSAAKKAYNFLNNIGEVQVAEELTVALNGGYYQNFRGEVLNGTFCGKAESDEYRAVVKAYENLDAETKAIVDQSEDFQFEDKNSMYTSPIVKNFTVGETMMFVQGYNNYVTGETISGLNNFFVKENSLMLIVLVLLTVTVLSISGFIVLKKRLLKK